MQVKSEKDLVQWNAWFNTSPDENAKTNAATYYHNSNNNNLHGDTCLDPLEKITDFDNNKMQIDCDYFSSDEEENHKKGRKPNQIKHLSRQMRLDSGVTTHRLLDDNNSEDDDTDRRGSETTVATLDSCYNHPVVMASEYGMDEINHARAVQQQLQLQRNANTPSISYSPSIILGSITDEEHYHSNQRPPNESASFYSSFAGYISSSGISTIGGVSDSEGTTAVATPLSISEEEINETNSYTSHTKQSNNSSNSNM